MPIKRRAAKSRKQLDDQDMEDLFYGPGTALLNGCGYLAPYNDGRWSEKSPEVQSAVIEAMRADWERHAATVMKAWHARSPHELSMAARYHSDPEMPWAATQFGLETER